MQAPARRSGWAGVFVVASLTGIASVGAQDLCRLSPTDVCNKFEPGVRLGCVKHVQLAVGFCRKAARKERFGSHEEHCRSACRAGEQAYVLEKRLREFAVATVDGAKTGNKIWRRDAVAYWQATSVAQDVCSAEQFQKARVDCDTHCSVTARRRDLEELQALAKGKEFLELQLPVFACRPGPALQLLSGNGAETLKHLYAPGDARRSGAADE
ncbi:MAG: hypothetical protein HKN11_17280 [Rhizobiales bacterium]|nr:hypothetical protein [Hyphomicrobiales bacterium]